MQIRSPVKKGSTIVVKVGTSILSDDKNRIDEKKIKKIATDIMSVVKMGIRVILVSSGSIGAGMGILGLSRRPQLLPELQAAAAIGQVHLMDLYNKYFKPYKVCSAQVLLTRDDFSDRRRYLNAKNTLFSLLNKNVITVVNENDTVSVDEIRFGDNDTLSSLVAALVDARLLVLLSNIDGLHHLSEDGLSDEIISEVHSITNEITDMICDSKKEICVGGMSAKIEAAKIAVHSGIGVIIANGMRKNVLKDIVEAKNIGTFFPARKQKMPSKKRWLAFTSKVKGKIIVDDGAKTAVLDRGKSLLSSGIKSVTGHFADGEAVSIFDEHNNEIAKGLSNYSSEDIKKIKGHKTSEIKSILGYKFYDEVVHRNNMVILK